MNPLKRFTLIGIIFVLVTGSLAHFVYDWSSQNFIIGFFFPVSESTWEHMKLVFFPMLLYGLFMYNRLKEDYPCLASALPAGILSGTFLIPVLALSVPLADTTFAFFRRIAHGQSPFHADKGHLHHRLMAMGLSQKQTVAVLYAVSASLGLFGVLLAGPHTAVRIVCLVLVFVISLSVWLLIFRRRPAQKPEESASEAKE